MRRSVNLIFLLTLLSAGILTGGTLVLGGRGDQVTVTARTLAGDPSAAEGLTVNLPLVLEDCLFWDLSFPADHPEQAVTQFRYDPEGEPPVYTKGSTSVKFPVGTGTLHDRDPLGEDHDPRWIAMLEELATGMRPDSQRHCTATLTDYMECWPMEAYLPDCPLSSQVLNQLVTDYFLIPIPQDYEAEFELTADSQGTLTRAVCYGDDRYRFQGSTWCFETPQGYLFTFSNTYYDWELNESLLLDGSRLPAGWGLYRLTVNGDSTGGQLETVYSLPEGSEILDFLAGGDGRRLPGTHTLRWGARQLPAGGGGPRLPGLAAPLHLLPGGAGRPRLRRDLPAGYFLVSPCHGLRPRPAGHPGRERRRQLLPGRL